MQLLKKHGWYTKFSLTTSKIPQLFPDFPGPSESYTCNSQHLRRCTNLSSDWWVASVKSYNWPRDSGSCLSRVSWLQTNVVHHFDTQVLQLTILTTGQHFLTVYNGSWRRKVAQSFFTMINTNIRIYHWLGKGSCKVVVYKVVCYMEVRPGL